MCTQEEVNKFEGINLAKEIGAIFQTVSAKEPKEFEDLFLKIAKQYINKLTEKNGQNSLNNNPSDDNIQVNDEINKLKNKNIELEKENKNLKEEINNLNNKNLKFQEEINSLKKNNSDLLNKLNNMNNNIEQNNQIKSVNNINDELISLKQKLEIKENEIKSLKEENDLLPIVFFSADQKIHYSIICKKTDLFNSIENKLYDIYPQYREYENKFYVNGNKINRAKTISGNNIKYSDIVMVITSDA